MLNKIQLEGAIHMYQQESYHRPARFADRTNPFEDALAFYTRRDLMRWKASELLLKADIADGLGRYERANRLRQAWSRTMESLKRLRFDREIELAVRSGKFYTQQEQEYWTK